MSDLKMAREALERIARPLDCGCVPCRGQCRSEEALRITVEEMQSEAREALKALSAPEAAPASPSPGAWTEEQQRMFSWFDEFIDKKLVTPKERAWLYEIKRLSTLNATPPAPLTSEEVEAVKASAQELEAYARRLGTRSGFAAHIRRVLAALSWGQAGAPSREAIENVVALAMSDGEYLGRHGSSMPQEKRKELRERCRRERTDAILALYPSPPAPAGLEEAVQRLQSQVAHSKRYNLGGAPISVSDADQILALLSQPPAVEDHVGGVGVGWKALGSALCTHAGGHYSWPPVGGQHAHDAEYMSLHGNDWHLPTIFAAMRASPALPEVAEMPGRES